MGGGVEVEKWSVRLRECSMSWKRLGWTNYFPFQASHDVEGTFGAWKLKENRANGLHSNSNTRSICPHLIHEKDRRCPWS
jgi:hypothetical protein